MPRIVTPGAFESELGTSELAIAMPHGMQELTLVNALLAAIITKLHKDPEAMPMVFTICAFIRNARTLVTTRAMACSM